MSHNEKAKSRNRIELIVVLSIYIILFLIIGFLLYRILHSNQASPSILPQTTTTAPAVAAVTPEPEMLIRPFSETTAISSVSFTVRFGLRERRIR